MTEAGPKVRLDKWLWAVRLFKTRSLATKACQGGKVKVAGESAKPARQLQGGEEVKISLPGGCGLRMVKVVKLIKKRVGASIAATCYEDHSPPPPPREKLDAAFYQPTPTRPKGEGRPTKKDRRRLDRLSGRG